MPIDPIDQELIEKANQGDVAAFEKIYYRYRDWIHRLAYRFTGDRDDALDVLQETFAYLLGKFPGFNLTAGMTTFLYPVVKHLAITNQQKRRRQSPTVENIPDLPGPVVLSNPQKSRTELAAVLAVLPAEQREIVLMRFVDDLALEEIAQALQIPSGTVKSRLYRALQTLKNDPRTQKYFLG